MILGYIREQNRIFLVDKTHTLISFKLIANVLNYQALVLANSI